MKRQSLWRKNLICMVAAVLALAALAATPARAGFILTTAADHYGILTEAGVPQLVLNNDIYNGNIGLGGLPTANNAFVMSSGTVTTFAVPGIDFAQNARNVSMTNGTINGFTHSTIDQAAQFGQGVALVTQALADVNALSASNASPVTSNSLNLGNNQTINVSSLTKDAATGNYYINDTSNGHLGALTINLSSPNDYVVINETQSVAINQILHISLNGVPLSNPATDPLVNHLLLNITGSGHNFTSSGGADFQGILLDPNGQINADAMGGVGRLYGGGTSPFSIQSNFNFTQSVSAVPEPASLTLVLWGLVPLGVVGLHRMRRRRAEGARA